MTVEEAIKNGKCNYQIRQIYLYDINIGKEIGWFKNENEIAKDILQRTARNDWDREYGILKINVE
ncbi:MAG: hypothetical protein IJA10_10800 [Lachnospiraceae bacterium]|nr:hypothetical protein [Lachnospiraceae bacterium]